jgi:hypothetical protein
LLDLYQYLDPDPKSLADKEEHQEPKSLADKEEHQEHKLLVAVVLN